MHRHRFPVLLLPIGVLVASLSDVAPCRAEDWPGWRGRDGNGVSPDEGFPAAWSEERNVAWSLETPAWGNSSPCVAGGRIYLTTQTEDHALHVLAIDRDAGKLVWSRRVGVGTKKHHELHNMASPTCVSDGERVWALFGTGDLVSLDRDGGTLWRRDLEKDHGEYTILWGMGSSPLLHEGRLFIVCMHGGPSYVLAVDGETGKDVWKTGRELECVGEAVDSYSSPVLSKRAGLSELVVAGADHVNAYDLQTGKERWISSGLAIPHEYGRSIASPTAAEGMVFAVSSGYAGLGRVLALDLGGEPAQGDISKSRRVWSYEKHSPDCPSPVVHGGLVWVIRDDGVGSCLVARTGEVKWRERVLRGDCKASPVVADGKVYFTGKSGETVVLKAGPEFEVLARNRLPGAVIATPALSDGTIYVRTRDRLWAIADAKRE